MPEPRTIFLIALLAMMAPVVAGEAGDARTSVDERAPIVFLPPPMEGTISVGIYNGAGKLVRILHGEAAQTDFKAGENGLVTRWDGRDDAGQPLPRGKYHVAGWMAGDLGVEGVAFHGNDWIKDNSPRYTRVTAVKNTGRDEVRVTLRTVEGRDETLAWKLSHDGVAPPASELEANVEDGRLLIRKGGASQTIELGEGGRALEAVVGSGDRVWAIVETSAGREVRAYSAQGEFLRRLAYQKDEPPPRQIAASLWEEMVFLLDENETEQRVRALAPGVAEQAAPAPDGANPQPAAVSTWRVTYLKSVLKADSFDAIAARLGRDKPLKAEAAVKIQARPNPLLGGGKPELSVKVSIDGEGAVLKTKDDLPLAHLTSTPNLKWAVFVKEGATLVLFQGDGAVVEEFKITHPENLMSFDAGECDLKAIPAKDKPASSPKRNKPPRSGDDL